MSVSVRLQIRRYDLEYGWDAPLPTLDSQTLWVLCFGAEEVWRAARPALAGAYPFAHRIGCSTAGEIDGATIHDRSLVCAIVSFEHTTLRTEKVVVATPQESYAAGRGLAQRLVDPALRAIFVLSDGTRINGSELARGLSEFVPPTVSVSGGLAGDGNRFERTAVMVGDEVSTSIVAAVGFYGDRLVVGHGSRGGWDPFGPRRVVTRAEGNVVYEIDGEPALSLYERYLGDLSAQLPASALLFPLALYGAADAEVLVRTILGIDRAQQSMTFAGDIPMRSIVQLMSANFDRIIGAAADAAQACADSSNDALAIAVSCVGRRLILGELCEEEVVATKAALSPSTRLIGFYSYGELSPYTDGRCSLHNQTMTLTTFGER